MMQSDQKDFKIIKSEIITPLIWCLKNINFLLLTFVLHKFVETVKPFFSVFGEYKVQTNSTWERFPGNKIQI